MARLTYIYIYTHTLRALDCEENTLLLCLTPPLDDVGDFFTWFYRSHYMMHSCCFCF